MRYQAAGVPPLVFAGEEYGTGLIRDWAARHRMALLGVKAVVARSSSGIHRSNLVGMALPLQFVGEDSWQALGLSWMGASSSRWASPPAWHHGNSFTLQIERADGRRSAPLPPHRHPGIEIEYYRHGGILPLCAARDPGRSSEHRQHPRFQRSLHARRSAGFEWARTPRLPRPSMPVSGRSLFAATARPRCAPVRLRLYSAAR